MSKYRKTWTLSWHYDVINIYCLFNMNIINSRDADVLYMFSETHLLVTVVFTMIKSISIGQQVTKLQVYMLVKKCQHCMMVRWQPGKLLVLLEPLGHSFQIGVRWKVLTGTVACIFCRINSFQLCIGVVFVLEIYISSKIELLHTCQDKYLDGYRIHSVIIWFRWRWTAATTFPRLKSTGLFIGIL
jgi:hypothetical protein